jgi:hypothetical protein
MQETAGTPATAENQQRQGLHNRRECQEKNRHQQTLATVVTLTTEGTPATVAMTATAKSTGNKGCEQLGGRQQKQECQQ